MQDHWGLIFFMKIKNTRDCSQSLDSSVTYLCFEVHLPQGGAKATQYSLLNSAVKSVHGNQFGKIYLYFFLNTEIKMFLFLFRWWILEIQNCLLF